jgi:hypothetical protein
MTKKTTKKKTTKKAIPTITKEQAAPFLGLKPSWAPPPVQTVVKVSHRAALFMKATSIIVEALEPYNNDERLELIAAAQAAVLDNPKYEPDSGY